VSVTRVACSALQVSTHPIARQTAAAERESSGRGSEPCQHNPQKKNQRQDLLIMTLILFFEEAAAGEHGGEICSSSG